MLIVYLLLTLTGILAYPGYCLYRAARYHQAEIAEARDEVLDVLDGAIAEETRELDNATPEDRAAIEASVAGMRAERDRAAAVNPAPTLIEAARFILTRR